jgi:hypothetical protein
MHEIVIRSEHQAWTYTDLENQIKEISNALAERSHPSSPIGLLADNSSHISLDSC